MQFLHPKPVATNTWLPSTIENGGASVLAAEFEETYFEKLLKARARRDVKAQSTSISGDPMSADKQMSSNMAATSLPMHSTLPWALDTNLATAHMVHVVSPNSPIPARGSARFQQLLQAKLAAESRRASPAPTASAVSPIVPLDETCKRLSATNTVFNRSFVAPLYQHAQPIHSGKPAQPDAFAPIDPAESGPSQIRHTSHSSPNARDEMTAIPHLPPTFDQASHVAASLPQPVMDGASTPDIRALVAMRIASMFATSQACMQETTAFDAQTYPGPSANTGVWQSIDEPPNQGPISYQRTAEAKFGEVIVKVEEVQDSPPVPINAWDYRQQDMPPAHGRPPASGQPTFGPYQSAYPFVWGHTQSQMPQPDQVVAPCPPTEDVPPLTPANSSMTPLPGPVTPRQASSRLFETGMDSLRLPPSYSSLNLKNGGDFSPESRARDTTLSPASSSSSRIRHISSTSPHSCGRMPYATMNGQIQLPSRPVYITTATEANGNGNGSGGHEYHQGAAGGSGNDSNGGSADGGSNGMTLNFGDSGGHGSGDGRGNDEQDPNQPRPKKLSLACHFCRRRKLKCDGVRPECENCARRGETCSYDDTVRRRGPGKRTKEMRERAAREAEAAGLVNQNSANPTDGLGDMDVGLAINASLAMESFGNEAGPSTLAEIDESGFKRGRKRRSEGGIEGDKRAKLEAEGDELTESDVHALRELEHLDESAFGSIDPALQHISESLAGAQSVAYHVDHGHGPSGYVDEQGNVNGDGEGEHDHLLV